MALKKIDLNSFLQVQLNESGKETYKKYVSSTLSLMPESPEKQKEMEASILSRIAPDGSMTISFTEMAQVFGPLIGTESHPFTSMEVKISETDILDDEPSITR